MAPVTRSEEEEAAFIKGLFNDLGDPVCNTRPSPASTPTKANASRIRSPTTPMGHFRNSQKHSSKHLVKAFSSVSQCGEFDAASFFEGVEDWDMDSDPLTPVKSVKQTGTSMSVKLPHTLVTCTRCTVESITEVEVNERWQKNLIVQLDTSQERRLVILQDDWIETDVRFGDILNVLGDFVLLSPSSSSITWTISITSQNNLIILHPDLLLTATALSYAPQCRRKPLLSALIRSSSDTSPALVWGNMLHEVMQACLSEARWEESWIFERIDEKISQNLMELVKLNIPIEQAKREMVARAKGLQSFASRYLSDNPKPVGILTNTRSTATQLPSLLAISQLLDVEEDIWSPTYGLKGKLDATVHAIISDPPASQAVFKSQLPTITSGPQPFEIKTGRAVAGMEHRAQTMLYTLLASERYGVDVPSGLLFYTQSDEVVRVPATRNELRGLFGARNEMASYMMRRHREDQDPHGEVQISGTQKSRLEEPFLPPTLDDERVCKRCYTLDACMLYRKALEAPMGPSSPIYDTYQLKTGHLTSSQCAFFKQWEELLSLEEQDLVRFKKELWTMGAAEREKKGKCFAGMILDASYRPSSSGSHKAPSVARDNNIHRFTYRFVRSANWNIGKENSFLNGFLNESDAITISVEPKLLALARGFIVNLTPTEVIVGVDHAISLENISARIGTMQVVFRIDRDEMFGGMGRIRDNLAHLFYAEGDTRRLALVVDLKAPTFSPSPDIPLSLARYTKRLDAHQKAAFSKVLSAEDYALILGMPGTGKTTVIAALIRALVELGKTVLLSSYTHSAVDTILKKLNGADFGILRLGNIDKIHPDVQKYTLAARKTATTIEQLEHQLMSPPVVATTCLSVDHALFTRRKFDYCIVDEASQITLPACLGPLRFANTFVLVGDHFQLPPLVRSRGARKGGLDVSLFRRLSDAHPEAVVDLAYQYRMNEDIMQLSNVLVYHDRLRCGSPEVAKRALHLPDNSFLQKLHKGAICMQGGERCWLDQLLSESCKAVFVDTDLVHARDSRVGDLVQNEGEAHLVHQVTEALLRSGINEEQIGIITLYRQQVKLLTHLLESRKNIEILTADRSQGRDKDCIIISMVRSNELGQIGDLVKDWRRMNVSFTRARSKLIIFGSRKTLKSAALLSQFFSLMEGRQWILQLSPKADKHHGDIVNSDVSNKKRRLEDSAPPGKENVTPKRPMKKAKVKSFGVDKGILKGRPILRDLVHDAF